MIIYLLIGSSAAEMLSSETVVGAVTNTRDETDVGPSVADSLY
jgi:hypothetical protein